MSRFRTLIQAAATALSNGYVIGFLKGRIYGGPLKQFCVPGLNCYSCPGALGSCPIGALQSVIGGRAHQFSFYALGMIMLFGVLLGRLVCGFLCPFGFVQDLLHRIPGPKRELPRRIDGPLRYLKYAVLLFLVILFPMLLTNEFGMGIPYFCQWLCPAGTLEGGVPLVLLNKAMRGAIGFLFGWKMLLLVITVLASVISYRPFCRYVCPLGALYALFNRYSFYHMRVDKEQCNDCGSCERHCKMRVEVRKQINSPECIRCGACRSVCPQKAICGGFSVQEPTCDSRGHRV